MDRIKLTQNKFGLLLEDNTDFLHKQLSLLNLKLPEFSTCLPIKDKLPEEPLTVIYRDLSGYKNIIDIDNNINDTIQYLRNIYALNIRENIYYYPKQKGIRFKIIGKFNKSFGDNIYIALEDTDVYGNTESFILFRKQTDIKFYKYTLKKFNSLLQSMKFEGVISLTCNLIADILYIEDLNISLDSNLLFYMENEGADVMLCNMLSAFPYPMTKYLEENNNPLLNICALGVPIDFSGEQIIKNTSNSGFVGNIMGLGSSIPEALNSLSEGSIENPIVKQHNLSQNTLLKGEKLWLQLT